MTSRPAPLRAKFQIGSCRGRMNYDVEERVFHASDVPTRARAAKREVQHYISQNKLPKVVRRPRFSASVGRGRFRDRPFSDPSRTNTPDLVDLTSTTKPWNLSSTAK